jgi:iron complex transport system permease protein
MGSLSGRTWADLAPLTVTLALVFPLCLTLSRDLNLLALGRQSAASLGVATGPVSLALLVAASLLAAVCVSVSGIIGFVGLLVPHLLRAVTGPDHRRLLPAALLAGAVLLLAADTVTRTLLPQEVPVGVLTALIGGPFFCYLFYRRHGMGGAA